MSNIYNWLKDFLAEYIYPWFDVKIYPFDLMDSMYDIDEIIFDGNEDTNKRIIQKINVYESLNPDEYRYLQNLHVSELLKFIRLYNNNINSAEDPNL